MGSISSRENGTLFFDFRYLGKRCKEYTKLKSTPPNKKRLEQILARIEAEITLGSFDYAKYFPDSSKVALFNKRKSLTQAADTDSSLFKDFAETWYSENIVRWRKSHSQVVRSTLDNYLIPEFGEKTIRAVNKAELLGFRAGLARIERKDGSKGLSNERINHIMTPLRMILTEAADRYEFTSPWRGIKSLKVPRTEVEPFTLEEVRKIINAVRADFRNYYTVRFFTGLRTGEIDGLLWKYVDFERRQILVRESYVAGEMTTTKTDGSQREIEMSQLAFDALPSTPSAHCAICSQKSLHKETSRPMQPNQLTSVYPQTISLFRRNQTGTLVVQPAAS